ncbi:MAG: SMC family ATPase [Prolixibacteraceae bacterium]|nr:SMC family ATPase [Prolixibacteraceae bacterium]MBN2648297.1 SMC family ATPase [Prolixibacteraceae bacterium]
MIPVSLTLQGLYSYQDKQTIDFTRLTSAHLFGIFGTVGSGKSSVLEAITFAIYGKTDRLNLSGDNRNYNMMNLKSDELLIDFIFETGKDQTAYRAVVKGKRNKKRFEDVKKLDRMAYQKKNNEWIPFEPSELEEAIGLSYENFKRTIIIPQGQFQEFLQLGNKDRTQMMKELFGLEKFEFYYKVAALESVNNEKRQNIEGKLQQLGAVDRELVKQYENQQQHLQNELLMQNEKLVKFQHDEQQWQQLAGLQKNYHDALKVSKDLEEQVPSYTELETKVKQYEQCVVGFKHLIEAHEAAVKKAEARKKQIERDAAQIKLLSNEIESAEKSLQALKPDYDKRETLKKKADELQILIKINTLSRQVENEQLRLENGDRALREKDAAMLEARESKKSLDEKLKKLKLSMPDMGELANAKAWHAHQQSLDKQKKESDAELVKNLSEANLCQEEFKKIITESDLLSSVADIEAAISRLGIMQENNAQTQKKLDEERTRLQVKAELQKYARDLTEGNPCPLCGSIHHPEKYHDGEINRQLQKLTIQKSTNDNEAEKLRRLIEKLKELQNKLRYNQQQAEDMKRKQQALHDELKRHKSKFNWPRFDDYQQLEVVFSNALKLQKEVNSSETDLQKVASNIEKMTVEKERYQLEIDKIRSQLTENRSVIKTLAEQLRIVLPADYQNKATDDIEHEKEQLLQKYDSIERQYDELNQKNNALQQKRSVLSGALDANQKELTTEIENIEVLSEQLGKQLEKSAFESISKVKAILLQAFDVEVEKNHIVTFNEKRREWKNRTSDLQKQLQGREYIAEKHEKVKAEIQALSTETGRMNRELGRIGELLKKLKSDIEKQKELRTQLDALELRGENIKTLKSLFKASGFVNYISSVYLQNLCNAANDRFFKLTRQKLSLEMTNENNFIVRDYLNGGKTRNVKTLSGGQTFQAALSLALSLADNIQKITESNQNFFFLDEGFGSLDKESLEVVFDTLKSLRNENRVVGVISHVEEMQQEIDIHLRIENDEKRGSLIRRSWEI